ncbi:MAG TPA: hypothetical protein VKI18_00365 [Albitalea sp.]|nr:hypothetical protein [Albitalea sp.]
MRKLYLSLILPLLMLLSQQGAVWHEIGHLSETSSPAERNKQQPADKVCESCLAFAHLAVAAKPDVPALPLAELSFARITADAVPFIASDAPAQRSRGPPRFL